MSSTGRQTGGRSHYEFVTRWRIDAPVDLVWHEISRPEEWPAWWRGVLEVVLLEPGASDGTGAYRRMTWRGRLPYRLRFNLRTLCVERPSRIEAAADGELVGRGVWTLRPDGRATRVRYEWRVDASRPWMRWLAPIARPVFASNHDAIMRWGLEGLSRRLQVSGVDETRQRQNEAG